MNTMDIRDRYQGHRFDSLKTDNKERIIRVEKTVESLLQRAVEVQHDEENSRKNPPRNPFHTRSVKLEFPRFDGTHAIEWIFKAEQFFEYYNTPCQD